ncbi:hypothetical protein WJX72_005630 [[Myrmecia] bisecta]|uniref:HhH-GPD domain-containing protein n=1 Tax=[Myrmecia] bisecta TaxID=41462 RepID=A0AAW1PP42_9CHLO
MAPDRRGNSNSLLGHDQHATYTSAGVGGYLKDKRRPAGQHCDCFGYRAKSITGSVAALLEKPGGGSTWLQSLRTVPYGEASEALCTLMGVGPKVRACIGLLLLDRTEAIPAATHVWQLAIRYKAAAAAAELVACRR